MNFKRITLSISALFIAVAMIGCGVSTKDAKTFERISARKLMADYKKDPKGTDAKYKDKVIEVFGVVNLVEKNNKVVQLKAGSDFLDLVQGTIEDDSFSKAKEGKIVTMKGKYYGMFATLSLTDCIIVK